MGGQAGRAVERGQGEARCGVMPATLAPRAARSRRLATPGPERRATRRAPGMGSWPHPSCGRWQLIPRLQAPRHPAPPTCSALAMSASPAFWLPARISARTAASHSAGVFGFLSRACSSSARALARPPARSSRRAAATQSGTQSRQRLMPAAYASRAASALPAEGAGRGARNGSV